MEYPAKVSIGRMQTTSDQYGTQLDGLDARNSFEYSLIMTQTGEGSTCPWHCFSHPILNPIRFQRKFMPPRRVDLPKLAPLFDADIVDPMRDFWGNKEFFTCFTGVFGVPDFLFEIHLAAPPSIFFLKGRIMAGSPI